MKKNALYRLSPKAALIIFSLAALPAWGQSNIVPSVSKVTFGPICPGQTQRQSIRITNNAPSGSPVLTITISGCLGNEIYVEFLDGEEIRNCGNTFELGGKEFINLSVIFAPRQAKEYSQDLKFSAEGADPATVTVEGRGIKAIHGDATLHFPGTAQGETNWVKYKVFNDSPCRVKFDEINFSHEVGPRGFIFRSRSVHPPFTIAANADTTIEVGFELQDGILSSGIARAQMIFFSKDIAQAQPNPPPDDMVLTVDLIADQPRLEPLPNSTITLEDLNCNAIDTVDIKIKNQGQGDWVLSNMPQFLNKNGKGLYSIISKSDSIISPGETLTLGVKAITQGAQPSDLTDDLVIYGTALSSPDTFAVTASLADNVAPLFIFPSQDTTLNVCVEPGTTSKDHTFVVMVKDNCMTALAPKCFFTATNQEIPLVPGGNDTTFHFRGTFPLGETSVTCRVDDGGNPASRDFKINLASDRQLIFRERDNSPLQDIDFGMNDCGKPIPAREGFELANVGTCPVRIQQVFLKRGSTFELLTPVAPGTIMAPGQELAMSLGMRAAAVADFKDTLIVLSDADSTGIPVTGSVQDTTRPVVKFLCEASFICTDTSASACNVVLGDSIRFAIFKKDGCGPVTLTVKNGSDTLKVYKSSGDTVIYKEPFPTMRTLLTFIAEDTSGNDTTINFAFHVNNQRFDAQRYNLNFGNTVECGTVANGAITVKNIGTCPLRIDSLQFRPNSAFALLDSISLPLTIAPGADTSLVFTFTPLGADTLTETVTVFSNALESLPIILAGRAVDTQPPRIEAPDCKLAFISDNSEDSLDVPFTITVTEECNPNPIVIAIVGQDTASFVDSTGNQYSFTHRFGKGTTTVTCKAFDNPSQPVVPVTFEVTVLKMHLETSANGEETCEGSIDVTATVEGLDESKRMFLKTDSCFIDGQLAKADSNSFSLKVFLKETGVNTIQASCKVIQKLSNDTRPPCGSVQISESIDITRFGFFHALALNEIFFDPVEEDLGEEWIEIKNFSDSTRSSNEFVLVVAQENADTVAVTYWPFPHNFEILPGQRTVIHWLQQGTNNPKDFFTGRPSTNGQTSFWGNNASDSTNMLLGGPSNTSPFALMLAQKLTPGDTLSQACKIIDFVQFTGREVGGFEHMAGEAGLWRPGQFIKTAENEAGLSFEFIFDSTSAFPALSQPDHYFKQSAPTRGHPNSLRPPPDAHLLISEICVHPNNSEFIEIFNPLRNDSTETIALDDYYLTNNSEASAPDKPTYEYTRIVRNKPDSLRTGEHDFIIRFPAGEKIKPREYLTVAFRARDFYNRYGVSADFEIFDTDSTKNMRIIKMGADSGLVELVDARDFVLLFKWDEDKVDDLVDDVDYVFWGKPGLIDKSGQKIDGVDQDLTESDYAKDTKLDKQTPIDTTVHPLLKSWQRRQNPREFGERDKGGNNRPTGHDETNENLAVAFRSEVPSPNEFSGALDLVAFLTDDSRRPNGVANRIVNPGEFIRLSIKLFNQGEEETGELHTRLTTNEPLVTILDGAAVLPSIGPRQSSGFSTDLYEFTVDSVALPDTLNFKLTIYSKPNVSLGSKEGDPIIATDPIEEIEIPITAKNTDLKSFFVGRPSIERNEIGRILRMTHNIHNRSNGGMGSVNAAKLNARLIFNEQVFERALNETAQADTIYYGDQLVPGDRTRDRSFRLVPLVVPPPAILDTLNRPDIVFEFTWHENIAGQTIKKTQLDTVEWRNLQEQLFEIKGSIKSWKRGSNVDSAQVLLENADTAWVALTDSEGNFLFQVSDPGEYFLSASKNGVPIGAIDSTDVDSARTYLPANAMGINSEDLNTVFAMIAANVNGGTSINPFDVKEISTKADKATPGRECLRFSVGRDWAFVDAAASGFSFFQFPAQKKFVLNNFDVEDQDFVGILYGDVDGSVDPGAGDESLAACTFLKITGEIRYHQPEPRTKIENALVKLKGGSLALTRTDSLGNYSFSGLLKDLSYRVEPATPRDSVNSVNANDGDLLAAYLENCGLCKVDDDPHYLRASDVDLDESVDEDDLIAIRHYIAKDDPGSWERTGEWGFHPEAFTFRGLARDTTANFKAFILGNVDTEYSVKAGASATSASLQEVANRQSLKVSPGDIFKLPFREALSRKLLANQLRVAFAEAQVEAMMPQEKAGLAKQSFIPQITRGFLTLSGADFAQMKSEALDLEFRVIGVVGDSSTMRLTILNADGVELAGESVLIKIVKKIPDQFFLAQNYPNPFNPTTTIAYGLPKKAEVQLLVFNVVGQLVHTLVDENQEAGYYKILWHGRNALNQPLPSGLYFVRMKAGGFVQTRKVTLLK